MESESFLALFRRHWDAGTGLKPGVKRPRGCWTNGDFLTALKGRKCEHDKSTVERWLTGTLPKSRPTLLAILDVFFGPEPAASPHADRQRMYDAWTEETRPGARRARSEPPEPGIANASDWPRENPKPVTGLAALELHTPRPDNQGGFHLHGRLDIALREDDSTEQAVRVGLREAYLAVETSQNLVTDGSLIGKREPAHENLLAAGDAVRVVGPKPAGECLEGEVFAGEHIAVVKLTDEAEGQVTLTLSVGRRAFVVTPLDDEGRPAAEALASEARDAVLNALIFERLAKDEAGRAVLQKAKLRKRAKPQE